MNEPLRRLVAGSPPGKALHLVREYLQAQVLSALQRSGAMIPMAFQGGTALRFLFDLPRFSEDLDFALVEGQSVGFDLQHHLAGIEREMRLQGIEAELSVSEKSVVQKAHLRFRGLAHSLGLSPHVNQTLTLRLEVDTRPPAGAVVETTLVRRHLLLHLQHHDRASLLAGKLHAILARPYPKGRDYYDLVWYLSDPRWPEPNLDLLNSALAQSPGLETPLTEDSWRAAILARTRSIDWPAVVRDVAPFLEEPEEIDLLGVAAIEKLLRER